VSVATDLRAWLLANAEIQQRLGDRISTNYAQSFKATPYAVMRRTARSQDVDLGGEGGIETTTLELTVAGKRGDDVTGIADAIDELVNGFPQENVSGHLRNWNGRTIQFAIVNDMSDDHEYVPTAGDEIEQAITLTLEVHSDG
jgi:hypothetical protein